MTSGIYKITHVASGKFYVGSAVNLRERWKTHRNRLNRGEHHNPHLQLAWRKYGAAAFDFHVVELVERQNLIAREQFWLDALSACRRGYNVAPTAGSRLGLAHSLETRRKIGDRQRGRKMSPEAVARSAAARVGYTASAATRAKISAAGKGRPKSEGMRQKLSASLKAAGWKPTDLMLVRARAANLGRKFSAETIAKRVETRARNRALRLSQMREAA